MEIKPLPALLQYTLAQKIKNFVADFPLFQIGNGVKEECLTLREETEQILGRVSQPIFVMEAPKSITDYNTVAIMTRSTKGFDRWVVHMDGTLERVPGFGNPMLYGDKTAPTKIKLES